MQKITQSLLTTSTTLDYKLPISVRAKNLSGVKTPKITVYWIIPRFTSIYMSASKTCATCYRRAIFQSGRSTDPMLAQCWPIVCDAGPTLNQYWVSISCMLSYAAQSKKAVTSYCLSKQLLPFGFAERLYPL